MNQIELIKLYRQKPIKFIKDVWKLDPQPVKNEYKNEVDIYVKNSLWSKIKKEHFDKFENGKHITWHQWLILLAFEKALIGEQKKRISIVSGHKCGKSSCVSWIILWFLFCYIDSLVAVTAPTGEQIHDVLWKEIKIWLDKMPQAIMDCYEWQSG